MENQIFHINRNGNSDTATFFVTCLNGNGYFIYKDGSQSTILGSIIELKNGLICSEKTERILFTRLDCPVSFRVWKDINNKLEYARK